MDLTALAFLDAKGHVALDAITASSLSMPQASLASPKPFVCSDGKTYWLKGKAQHGLAAELICGRLAGKLSAGPGARIVRVSSQTSGNPELNGLVVGVEDQRNAVNSKDIQRFTAGGGFFNPSTVDEASRSRVIAFQTWIGVDDAQVLIELTRGRILSIDHGGALGSTGNHALPKLVIASIPSVPDTVGKNSKFVTVAVQRIEEIADQDLLEVVAAIPDEGDAWNASIERRLEVAEWLAYRRNHLKEAMDKWLTS